MSGAAGLIYEVCWIRRASLVFGSTIQALSTVLAVFFLGLALGSYVFGRLSHRSMRPLRVYAVLEIVLAVFAVLSLPAFDLAGGALVSLSQHLPDPSALVALARFGLVAAIVAIPAVLMGGTLPLFCRQFVRNRGRLGQTVASLYALNTLGAAVGCSLAGIVLLPSIGLSGSIAVGSGLSLVAGLMTLRPPTVLPPSTEGAVPESARRRWARTLPALFVLAGFTALAYEVLWTRFLALIIRNTVYTYTLTLSMVLVGIVLGSFLASFLADRARSRGALFGALQSLSGLTVLATMLLPPVAWQSLDGDLQVCAALLLPAAALSGAAFPIGVRMVVENHAFAGIGVGRIAALNTLGGIVGSITAGFFLLPRLGLHTAVLLCTGLSVATGILAWWLACDRGWRRNVATAAAALAWVVIPRALPTQLPNDFLNETGRLVDVHEGLQANLAVIERGGDLILEIDRWWQGQLSPTQQVWAAHVPMLLHPNPRKVLVVGVGAGQTPSRITFYDVEQLDCVDIEPGVFDIVRQHYPSEWLHDRRVRILADDGRNWIARTAERYDVISLEVGQIFRPGVSTFYTADFFRIARSRLRPGGVVSQLVKLSLPPDVFRRVISSFLDAFPQSVLWYNTSEFLLLGVNADHVVFDRARLASVASNPEVARDFSMRYYGDDAYALRNPQVFLGGFVCGPRGLAALAAGAPPYRDDPPVLDYVASRLMPQEANVLFHVAELRRLADPLAEIVRPPQPSDTLLMAARVRALNFGQLEVEVMLREAAQLERAGPAGEYGDLLARAVRANPENFRANLLLGAALQAQGQAAAALPYIEKAAAIEPRDPRARQILAALLSQAGLPGRAVRPNSNRPPSQ